MARFAFRVNEGTENIGARRLHTIMERVLDEITSRRPKKRPTVRSRRGLRAEDAERDRERPGSLALHPVNVWACKCGAGDLAHPGFIVQHPGDYKWMWFERCGQAGRCAQPLRGASRPRPHWPNILPTFFRPRPLPLILFLFLHERTSSASSSRRSRSACCWPVAPRPDRRCRLR